MLLFTLIGLVASAFSFETTICDCSKPKGIGLLTFSDGICEPATKIGKTRVNYQVMTDRKAAYNFPGFIYSRWRNTKHVTEDFLDRLQLFRNALHWTLPRFNVTSWDNLCDFISDFINTPLAKAIQVVLSRLFLVWIFICPLPIRNKYNVNKYNEYNV